MLLVLDIDETLLHATREPLVRPSDLVVGPFHVYLRPHLFSFLDYALAHFSVAIWTSGTTAYGRRMSEALFSDVGVLDFVWARERCTLSRDLEQQTTQWLKDFKKLKRRGYALEQVLVVDDTPEKHVRNYGNLIRISPYFGQVEDYDLLWLCNYLEELRHEPNVRRIEKRGWRERFLF